VRLIGMVWDDREVKQNHGLKGGAECDTDTYSRDHSNSRVGGNSDSHSDSDSDISYSVSVYEILRSHLRRYDHSEIRKTLRMDSNDSEGDSSGRKQSQFREYEAYLDSLVEYNVYNWATNAYDENL
jgi:hypothetical protein